MAGFYSLPTELHLQIFNELDSVQDFYSLIKASPDCFRQFSTRKLYILKCFVRKRILPEALPWALQLIHFVPPDPQPHHSSRPHDEAELLEIRARSMLESPIERTRWEENIGDIVRLARVCGPLQAAVEGFVTMIHTCPSDRKPTEAWQLLPFSRGQFISDWILPWDDYPQDATDLSPSELLHCQRAFLRSEYYNLVCKVRNPDLLKRCCYRKGCLFWRRHSDADTAALTASDHSRVEAAEKYLVFENRKMLQQARNDMRMEIDLLSSHVGGEEYVRCREVDLRQRGLVGRVAYMGACEEQVYIRFICSLGLEFLWKMQRLDRQGRRELTLEQFALLGKELKRQDITLGHGGRCRDRIGMIHGRLFEIYEL